MLAKLAFRNVKRAGRDYAIYFITVALGVALFYAFNAIRSQAVLFDAMSTENLRMLDLLTVLIRMFSVVVACVLGFLVVYANRFLIRRRRREFGTYLLLGMSAGRVSRVLLCETVLVGIASLVAGLVLGLAISQGLSFATAALIGTTMTKYHFILSTDALVLTVLCFVVVFAVSAIVDVIYVRRCKLINLLSIHESNERAGIRRMPLRIACFVISLIILGCAYWQLIVSGFVTLDDHFWAATVLMLVGTFLFFWSVSGFVIFALTRAKGVYLKGIRMFTVRQIASKVNTAFVSVSVVCVMLFFALTTASVGMGMLELFTGNLEQTTRYDATIVASQSYSGDDDTSWQDEYRAFDGDIAARLSSSSSEWDDAIGQTAQLDYWSTGVMYETLLDQTGNAQDLADSDSLERIGQTEIRVVSQSQYNASCALIDEQGVQLAEDQFAIDNTISRYEDLGEALSGQDMVLQVAGASLHGSGTLQNVPLDTSATASTGLRVIVPDQVVSALRQSQPFPFSSTLNLMYRGDRAQGDESLATILAQTTPLPADSMAMAYDNEFAYATAAWPVTQVYTSHEMIQQAGGVRMVITFLALYIGFVMLVATAAVLAIQQLSETADSLGRYHRLSDLGCEMRRIMGSLRTQTVVYFCAPLVLAACHTVCAVMVVSSSLFAVVESDPTGLICIAVGIIVAVYAVYLVATYLLSKSIVRGSILRRSAA